MSQFFTIKKGAALLLFVQMIAFAGIAQVKYKAKDNLKVSVSGTSTLHDWTMETTKGECNAVFTQSAGQLTDLTSMSVVIPVESLKSEKAAMDKNAYKALKAKENPTFSYTLTSATITDGKVKCLGKLTLAGTTVNTEIDGTAKVNADKSITVTGSKKISMTAYKITPPTFMMGTIKTGNDITVSYTVTLRTN